MIAEVTFLSLLLFIGFILAPVFTNKFFLNSSRLYSEFHKISLIVLIVGWVFELNYAAFIWPLFCIFGSLLYLKNEYKTIFTTIVIAKGIPFVFSVISSIWFVSATNDFHLLGYGQVWSLYAALHGCFLGWIFVGCVAYLSTHKKLNKVYLYSCYLSLVLFLFVAFGINGVPFIKRIGAVGFSVIVPLVIGLYAFNLKKEKALSLIFSRLSLFFIIFSMALAMLNEFWMGFPKIFLGLPTMVLVHGTLNAVFVLPLFILAIVLEHREFDDSITLKERVVFFDGFCILCSKTVSILLDLDKNKWLKYSSLQGEYARNTLDSTETNFGGSVIFWNKGISYKKAEAVIQILLELGGKYKIAGIFLKIFPLFFLNWLYDFIAYNRYRIFGKNDICLVPTNENKDQFIS